MSQIKDYIISKLLSHGFTQDNTKYTFQSVNVVPGPTININGRIVQQTPHQIKSRVVFDFVGEGCIESENEFQELLEWVDIYLSQNEREMNIQIAFYEDDRYYFEEIWKNIFG